MTDDEFAQQLEAYKQEFINDVLSHYKKDNQEQGRLAFQQWKERFTAFLREHTPDEADRFEIATSDIEGNVKNNKETIYSSFMRKDGKTCLTFLDGLTGIVSKRRVVATGTVHTASPKMLVKLLKVFLSYAREDVYLAQRLFHDLQAIGADIWFDKESLLPGHRWKISIREAIKGRPVLFGASFYQFS